MSLTKILTTYSGRKKSIKSVVEKNNLKSMIICKNLWARTKQEDELTTKARLSHTSINKFGSENEWR